MDEQRKDSHLGTLIKSSVVGGESYHAFLPPPLPPEPALELAHLQKLLVRAGQSIGRLSGVADIIPDSNLLLYYYVRKEAVLSSQIEGTQSSLSDLLMHESNEAPAVPLDDVAEVKAMSNNLTKALGVDTGGMAS